jgi:hypothetical protein
MVWRPSFPNLHAQVNNCSEPNLLLGNQARCWNLLSSSYISPQTHCKQTYLSFNFMTTCSRDCCDVGTARSNP